MYKLQDIRVQPRRALLGHFGSTICGAGGTAPQRGLSLGAPSNKPRWNRVDSGDVAAGAALSLFHRPCSCSGRRVRVPPLPRQHQSAPAATSVEQRCCRGSGVSPLPRQHQLPLPRQHQSAGHGRGGPNSDRAAPPRPSTTATVAQPAFALSFALSALRVKTGLRACLDRPSGLSRSRPNKRL